MDLNGLIGRMVNMFLRKAVNKGINAGVDLAARRGKSPSEMTPADHEQARKGRELAKRARQAAKLTRRMGR
jgi:DNA invertase Pin-like site-specific DNA recombinase